MSELEQYTGFLNVQTGEILDPGLGSAATALNAVRAMKAHGNAIVQEITAYLVALSEHQGTKTLTGDGEKIVLTGGMTVEYNPVDLVEALEAAGCPEDRINLAVKATITYKVDRAVLRQLAGANPDYKAAIASAETTVEKPFRASVTLRRNLDD